MLVEKNNKNKQAFKLRIVYLCLLIVLLSVLSILTGAGELDAKLTLEYLLQKPEAIENSQLILAVHELRIPRTLAAILIGSALGCAACLMQNITSNPLAEPGLLGVNAGAACGVVIGITFYNVESVYSYLIWAFIGAGVANALIIFVSDTNKHFSPLRIVLAGIAISSTLVGLTSFLLLANVKTLDQFQYWTMGSLSGVDRHVVWTILPVVMIAIAFSFTLCRPLSALLLGKDTAQSLGHSLGLLRLKVILTTTVLAGSAVALAGPIGFVGLIAAFFARQFGFSKVAEHMSYSLLFGILLVLFADILARIVSRPSETPASVLLALMGAPLLIFMVRRHSHILMVGNGRG